jgi:hypothetical protein
VGRAVAALARVSVALLHQRPALSVGEHRAERVVAGRARASRDVEGSAEEGFVIETRRHRHEAQLTWTLGLHKGGRSRSFGVRQALSVEIEHFSPECEGNGPELGIAEDRLVQSRQQIRSYD